MEPDSSPKVSGVTVDGPQPAQTGAPQPAPAAASPFGITTVTDSKGRVFGLRKLKPSERYQLNDAVEANTMSSNLQLITAATVISIDQEGLPPIANKAQLLQRLDRIGDEGLEAITSVVLKMYGLALDKEAIEAAKN